MDKQFYLVEKDGKQFFCYRDGRIFGNPSACKSSEWEKIEIGNWKFTKCEYEVKE